LSQATDTATGIGREKKVCCIVIWYAMK